MLLVPIEQSVRVILPWVSVPVLSEQMTETEPSVSTVLRDLQRIMFFFIMLAVMVRPAVMAIGRPSGMNATATLTQLTMSADTEMKSGWSRRSQAPLFSSSVLADAQLN